MKKDPYQPIEADVEEIVIESPTIKTFTLRPREEISFAAGQFIELSLDGTGEAPFTPSSDPNLKDRIEVTAMNVGRVTAALHQINKGGVVGIRGPYGIGYSLDEFKGKNILIVGGGVGLAPLRSLLYVLLAKIADYKKVYLRYGAKTPADIIYKKEFVTWQKQMDIELSVDRADNDWKGRVGVVTVLLDNFKADLSNTVSVVCGPPIMMKFTTLKLRELGFAPENIYLSMEKNMSCGLGRCGHCRVGKYYVCKDGPVFNYAQLQDIPDIWD